MELAELLNLCEKGQQKKNEYFLKIKLKKALLFQKTVLSLQPLTKT